MKVKIEVTARTLTGDITSMVIEGTIVGSLSTQPLSHKKLGEILFQMEYTLNEHAPGMRVHIGLESE